MRAISKASSLYGSDNGSLGGTDETGAFGNVAVAAVGGSSAALPWLGENVRTCAKVFPPFPQLADRINWEAVGYLVNW